MKNVGKFLLSVSLCLLCSMATVAMAKDSIKTLDLAGLETLLNEHRGKVVVVNFFATWCPPCREEIPGLVEISKERAEDVVIIGLSVDKTVTPLPKFLEQYGVTYEVVRAHTDIQQLFAVNSIPHNVVLNKEGDIVANESGFVTKKQLNDFIDSL